MNRIFYFLLTFCLVLTACKNDDSVKLIKAISELEKGDAQKGEEMLFELAQSDSETGAEACLQLAKFYASTAKPEESVRYLEQAEKKGSADALIELAEAYSNGSKAYGIQRSDSIAAIYYQQLVSMGRIEFSNDLLEIYMFSPQARDLRRAADMIDRKEVLDSKLYTHILQYMDGKGSITHNIENAVGALKFEPTAETAAYMGHILMIRPQNRPTIDIPQVLRYYNKAIEESKYVDKEALQKIVDVIQEYYNLLSKYPVNDNPFLAGTPGFHTYTTFDDYTYTGEVGGGYPKGWGLGHCNEFTYCGKFNRIFAGTGVKYESNGDIYCGEWVADGMSRGVILKANGDVVYWNLDN